MHQLIDKKNRIVLYLISLIILSTVTSKNIEIQKDYSITINKINVTGLSNSKNVQIEQKLSNYLEKNIFILKKKKINKIISEYNIIEEYNVKKIYPSMLNLEIKPTKFIAKISGSNHLLIGSNGKIIKNQKIDEVLPYLFGKFNTEEFLEFKKNVELSQFKLIDLKSIFFYPSNRWDILTLDDILIKLPQQNLLKSLNFANKILVRSEFKNIKLIDLRIKNNLIIK